MFARYPARDGLPGRGSTVEQARFILGYHQQRAHDISEARKHREKNEKLDLGDLPEMDEPIDNDNPADQNDEGGTHD